MTSDKRMVTAVWRLEGLKQFVFIVSDSKLCLPEDSRLEHAKFRFGQERGFQAANSKKSYMNDYWSQTYSPMYYNCREVGGGIKIETRKNVTTTCGTERKDRPSSAISSVKSNVVVGCCQFRDFHLIQDGLSASLHWTWIVSRQSPGIEFFLLRQAWYFVTIWVPWVGRAQDELRRLHWWNSSAPTTFVLCTIESSGLPTRLSKSRTSGSSCSSSR